MPHGPVHFLKKPFLPRKRSPVLAVALGDATARVGHRLLDEYLGFVAARGRPNTVLATAYDLKVFFAWVAKEPADVSTADVIAFIAAQRSPRTTKVVRIADGGSGLSARTVARRLSSLSGLFAYLVARGDAGVVVNPVPKGLATRRARRNGGRGAPLVRTPRTLPRILGPAEVDRLVAALRTVSQIRQRAREANRREGSAREIPGRAAATAALFAPAACQDQAVDMLPVPDTDPSALLRARDGIYADDLLIAAVAHLDLFTALADEACDGHSLADRLGLAHRPADVMCTLFRAMGLLEPGPMLRPTALGAEYLVRGSRFDLRPYLDSLAKRPTCLEVLDVVRTDRPAPWASTAGGRAWADGLDDEAFAATTTAAMHARGACLAPGMAAAIADLPATAVLDVAGGSGVYAYALLEDRPGARATILERPPVDAVARRLVTAVGNAERVTVVSGDMFVAVPEGHDLHLLSHTLHDWGEHDVHRLLERCFDALAPGGWLVDHDAHVNRDKTGPLPVARYSVLLMHTTAGKCWSVAELETILEDVGFADVEERPAGPDRSVVLARKPS